MGITRFILVGGDSIVWICEEIKDKIYDWVVKRVVKKMKER